MSVSNSFQPTPLLGLIYYVFDCKKNVDIQPF